MSGEKGADIHKEELKGEEVEVKVKDEAEEEGTDSSRGSLSIPDVSKKHILIGAILVVVAYGALRWLSSDGKEEDGDRGAGADASTDGGSETDDGDGGSDEVDISEDIDFSEFDDIEEGAEEDDGSEDAEDMSFEETQERAANEITEDTPF